MSVGDRVERWVRHQSVLSALTECLRVLESHGIPTVVVKGMVLAYSLYDDVADRPLSDVDLRIRPVDFVRAIRAMLARGFRARWESRQLGAASFRVGGELVEFETSVGPPGLCALSVSRLLERSRERVLPNGLRVREPEIHDHAVHLLVNAFKDKMVLCPPWSLDDLDTIALRVQADVLLARIAEARVTTLAWIAADWMARERGSERWRALRDRMRAPRPVYAWAMGRLFANGHASLASRALTRVASDSRTGQLWALTAAAAGAGVSWVGQRWTA